ncbi:hypothetical protein O4H52_20125 [Sphingomonadaceae bacterium G21617-S1]|nr:hypothetical protein [Sphingomonadaceae bacterium G21617-S1]
MRTCKLMWIGLDGIDISGDTLEEGMLTCQLHVARYLLDNHAGIDQLRRDIADGKIEPTYSTLTINDDHGWDDGNGDSTPPVIVIHVFPETR